MAVDPESFSILQESVARFVRERLLPREREIAALEQPPKDLLDEVRELGLFGLTFPEQYGGLELDPLQEVKVGFELGRASPAMRNFISIHNGVAGQSLNFGGTAAQKAKYMPRLASGELIAAFALTEPDVGSDARSIQTKAEKTPDGWVINGRKRFISNAPFAGLITVLAKTQETDGELSVSAFLVEANTPGMSIARPEHKMGQQGAPICDIVFDDCRLGGEALLGAKTGIGLKAAMAGLDRGRLFIASCCVGLAYRLLEDATDYGLQRVQFGVPIVRHQLIQALLADSLTEAYAAQGMVENAARLASVGRPIGCEASMCKLYATEMVGRVADRAVQIHGGNGYISDYMVEQLYRDVRVLRIYEGTSQIQQTIIAKHLTARRQNGERLG
ncbi:acyl-CoA dehydrogenase family protein [Tardiphaga sp. 215_C5_N2_1]|uniref:acyl-CoA dehydrogenase family protein n=1 Tax=Tardiphaga sp. 215_C5_N2_1 TaxID=3240774 RepID=UPI003F8C2CD3